MERRPPAPSASTQNPAWFERTDYAKLADLQHPLLHSTLQTLREFQAEFLTCVQQANVFADNPWIVQQPDVLHHWSRCWEYPYAVTNPGLQPGTMLDAGSGLCFFPFWWATHGWTVHAVDYDPRYAPHFDTVRRLWAKSRPDAGDHSVQFSSQDIHRLNFPDATFDLICCISVLEHLDRTEEVLREFARVLKPTGRVVITCDVSLDGRSEIRPPELCHLLGAVERHFDFATPAQLRFDADVLTTDHFRHASPELLPWRPPRFRRRWLLNPRYYLQHARYQRTPFYSLAALGLKLGKKTS